MRSRVAVDVMRRLLAVVGEPTRETSPRTSRLAVARYTDPRQLDREREVLFGRRPVIVAHVSEVPGPGDFITETVADTPLLVLRDGDGRIRVFVNACRHRGARLVDGERGSCNKALTCNYHAWSYRLDGGLMHVPRRECFAELDRGAHGLRAVEHAVRHGFVWALPRKLDPDGGDLDIADYLGPILDDDFDAFALADHRVSRTSVTVRRANWKLVMDAFAEGYHLKSLHRRSLARFFLEGAILDDCAPHVRQVGARKALLEAARQPENTWQLRKLTTVFYNVFPNTVLVFHPYWISQMSLFPEAVDRVRVVHRMLVADRPLGDDERARLDKSFAHIDGQVFAKEDLAIAESIHGTLASGANSEIVLGGLEEGMRLFHRARDRALAEG